MPYPLPLPLPPEIFEIGLAEMPFSVSPELEVVNWEGLLRH